ncbi:MAG: 3-dehydroquinate synthase [Prevotella sp.]|jgi:3-dehydroquinate synthase
MHQSVIISKNINTELATAVSDCEHDKLFVLVDDTTSDKCWPLLQDHPSLKNAQLITIKSTDTHKNLDSLTHVWQALQKGGATRHSCMVNLGGGMVTDLGGFAASTFKRGINFINIPTTLLAMVDASVGGKTGINFGGLKNEIGVFSDARVVILDTAFLQSLDAQNLRSGYAEMLKHGLISNEKHWAELLRFDLDAPDFELLKTMLAESVRVKEDIVREDPTEHGLRKALNLGHTFGHAFESFSFKAVPDSSGRSQAVHPLLHGYAVAFGLICELYLSTIKLGFPSDKMQQTVRFIRDHYGSYNITCNDYPELIALMMHDKKNTAGIINFTLLGDIGDIRINQTATQEEIKEALDFFRET